MLSKLRSFGGWGIKDLDLFNLALYAKSMWRGMLDDGLWGKTLRFKYMQRISVTS